MDSIRKLIKNTDWIFLVFLLIFLNQSNFSLKTIGIIFIYCLRPNFNFGFLKGRLPKFYVIIIALALVNVLFNIRDFSFSYLVAFSVSATLWIYCFLGYHQVKLAIEKHGDKIDNTLIVFTILNFAISIIQLLRIMIITGELNPYSTTLHFPYGLSTGDNVFGIFLQNCYYNVMTCSFLAIYFLYKRNFAICILASATIILVFANTGTIIFISALALIFATGIVAYFLNKKYSGGFSHWLQQIAPPANFYKTIPVIFLLIGILSFIISPENVRYTFSSFISKIHQGVTKTERKKIDYLQQQAATIKDDNAGKNRTTLASKEKYAQLIQEKEQLSKQYVYNYKGKKLSLIETMQYFTSSPQAFVFGAGPVRFSSLTAQKMSGYDSSRIFRKILPRYSSKLYAENHGLIIKARVESPPDYWSSINWPDCFYNQLLGEYGAAGAVLFLVFYVWYFIRKIKYWTYGIWLSMLMVVFSLLTYMFEPLTVAVIFELLMEIDMRNGRLKQDIQQL